MPLCGCLPSCTASPCDNDECRYHHIGDHILYCPLAGVCVDSEAPIECRHGKRADPHRNSISVGLALLTKLNGTDCIVLQAAAENTLAVLDILRTNIDVPNRHSLTRSNIAEKCLEGCKIPANMVVPFRTISVNNTLIIVAALKPALSLKCLVSTRPLVFAPLCENASTMSGDTLQLVKRLIKFGLSSKTNFVNGSGLVQIQLDSGYNHHCLAKSDIQSGAYLKLCGCQPKCVKPDCTGAGCYQYHEGDACALAGVRVESATSSPFEVVCKYGRPADPHRNTISVGVAIVLRGANGSISFVTQVSESWDMCLKVDMLRKCHEVTFLDSHATLSREDLENVCLKETRNAINGGDLKFLKAIVVGTTLTFVSELPADVPVSHFMDNFKAALGSATHERRTEEIALVLVPLFGKSSLHDCVGDTCLKLSTHVRDLGFNLRDSTWLVYDLSKRPQETLCTIPVLSVRGKKTEILNCLGIEHTKEMVLRSTCDNRAQFGYRMHFLGGHLQNTNALNKQFYCAMLWAAFEGYIMSVNIKYKEVIDLLNELDTDTFPSKKLSTFLDKLSKQRHDFAHGTSSDSCEPKCVFNTNDEVPLDFCPSCGDSALKYGSTLVKLLVSVVYTLIKLRNGERGFTLTAFVEDRKVAGIPLPQIRATAATAPTTAATTTTAPTTAPTTAAAAITASITRLAKEIHANGPGPKNGTPSKQCKNAATSFILGMGSLPNDNPSEPQSGRAYLDFINFTYAVALANEIEYSEWYMDPGTKIDNLDEELRTYAARQAANRAARHTTRITELNSVSLPVPHTQGDCRIPDIINRSYIVCKNFGDNETKVRTAVNVRVVDVGGVVVNTKLSNGRPFDNLAFAIRQLPPTAFPDITTLPQKLTASFKGLSLLQNMAHGFRNMIAHGELNGLKFKEFKKVIPAIRDCSTPFEFHDQVKEWLIGDGCDPNGGFAGRFISFQEKPNTVPFEFLLTNLDEWYLCAIFKTVAYVACETMHLVLAKPASKTAPTATA